MERPTWEKAEAGGLCGGCGRPWAGEQDAGWMDGHVAVAHPGEQSRPTSWHYVGHAAHCWDCCPKPESDAKRVPDDVIQARLGDEVGRELFSRFACGEIDLIGDLIRYCCRPVDGDLPGSLPGSSALYDRAQDWPA